MNNNEKNKDLQIECEESIDKRILPGMNEKKLHEVSCYLLCK